MIAGELSKRNRLAALKASLMVAALLRGGLRMSAGFGTE